MKSNSVVKSVSLTTDWAGKPYVLINCSSENGDMHIYVPDGHPLAAVQGGHTLRVVVK